MDKKKIKESVRKNYAKVAKENTGCCGSGSSCCGSSTAETISKNIGYSEKEMKSVPEGANLGLGCGNPTALAELKKGDTVLDLGSGAGFDSFLVAQKAGKEGRVIGVDMTPEMIKKARANAEKSGYKNVEFRLGEIENLPVEDNSIDAVISNCVINLSPDKPKVFKEILRVLKKGGRFFISDIVLLKKLPEKIREDVSAYIGCISGALLKEEYMNIIKKTGFRDIKILDEKIFPVSLMANDLAGETIRKTGFSKKEIEAIENSILSIKIKGRK